MITLLSPSKKLNFKHQDAVSLFTQCDFIESAQELVNKAKNLTSQDLKDLMKISDSLADLNKDRFNSWSLPFNKENKVHVFHGCRFPLFLCFRFSICCAKKRLE